MTTWVASGVAAVPTGTMARLARVSPATRFGFGSKAGLPARVDGQGRWCMGRRRRRVRRSGGTMPPGPHTPRPRAGIPPQTSSEGMPVGFIGLLGAQNDAGRPLVEGRDGTVDALTATTTPDLPTRHGRPAACAAASSPAPDVLTVATSHMEA